MYVAVRGTLYGNAYQAPGAAEGPALPASNPVPFGPAPYARCGSVADFHSIE